MLIVKKTWKLLERDSLLPEGTSFYEGVPQAEPRVFGRRRVCRRRRPEDPPQVGLGVYRRRRQPGRRVGE